MGRRQSFPTSTPIRGWIWRWSAWGSNRIDLLPVASRANIHALVGIVTLHAVLDAYAISHP